jgi:hypothetical protein
LTSSTATPRICYDFAKNATRAGPCAVGEADRQRGDIAMNAAADIAFLFDVDNTLIDNDCFQDELRKELQRAHGDRARAIGRLSRSCAACSATSIISALWSAFVWRTRTILRSFAPPTGSWTIRSPIASIRTPSTSYNTCGELDPPSFSRMATRSFSPTRSCAGLWHAFDGNVLIYIHKEIELADVQRWHPARRYVLIDDRAVILAAVKAAWGDRDALQEPPRDGASVDIAIDKIGLDVDLSN